VTSQAVTVVNSPPYFTGSPSVDPFDVADDGTALKCQNWVYETDPDGDPITYKYRWRLNDVDAAQTGDSIAATLTSPGDRWSCQVTASDGFDSVTSSLSDPTRIVTQVSGILRTDTTWAAAKSPYYLADRVQLASGITLKLEPGVIVIGNGYSIEAWGSISMLGTKDKPILVLGLTIMDNSTALVPGNIELAYVQYNNGILFNNLVNASTRVTDCVLQDLQQSVYLGVSTGASHVFERNVFRGGNGIFSEASMKLTNNVFVCDSSYGTILTAFDSLVANCNSFINPSGIVLQLGPKSADVRNNFWGGLSDTAVPQCIVGQQRRPQHFGFG
jgi:hypothetical protein